MQLVRGSQLKKRIEDKNQMS